MKDSTNAWVGYPYEQKIGHRMLKPATSALIIADNGELNQQK